jgi:hypothetical protein
MTVDPVALLLKDLHKGEHDLAAQLRRAAHDHADDHDVRHGAVQLSGWSQTHVSRLAETAEHYGLELTTDDVTSSDGAPPQPSERTSKALDQRLEPALLLLYDLRELHLSASRNNLTWEMLAQAAKASRDSRLLDLSQACQPQTVRQMRWTTTLIKELAPQALTIDTADTADTADDGGG